MIKFRLPQSIERKTDRIIGGLLLIVVASIFWFSPNRQIVDSKYSMLVSESLLQHHSFMLDFYRVPHLAQTPQRGWIANGDIYQLEWIDDHLYYSFPPGTSVLSVPYVLLLNAFGISAVKADGTPDLQGETTIQASLAALLMALLASVFFFTARLLLPRSWSVLVALAGALGTQVWSTASRGLWTDTWALLLLGIVVWMLFAQETGKRRINPAALATLLAWTYFARPTNAIPIAAITLYLFVYHRRLIVPYAATGAAWCAGFVAYSWYHFRHALPGYYMANRLSVEMFWTALAGNLISPSRGLLVFVPALFFVTYLLVRYRRELELRRLVVLSIAISVGHLAVVSSFLPWHGGGCYGPRYSTGLVPWFVLLGVLGINAMRRWRAANAANVSLLNWHMPLGAGALLVLLSVLIQARGAASIETAHWHVNPVNVDFHPERVWDWRYPQFMAGLILPPLPDEISNAPAHIDFASQEFEKYKWHGWSTNEGQFRWTGTNDAGMVFALDKTDYSSLQIKLGTFLVPGKLDAQHVNVVLNGRELARLTLSDVEARIYSVKLPENALRHTNILTLKMPDAASPEALGVGSDGRSLGVRAEWMEFQP